MSACAEDEPEEVICTRVGYTSGAGFTIHDYGAVRGHDDARVRLCLDGIGCGSVDVRIDSAAPDGVDCSRPESADALSLRCWPADDGALAIVMSIEEVALETQRRRYDVVLVQDGLEVRGSGVMELEARTGNGEGCGLTHVEGMVRLDPTTLRQVEPT